MISETVPEEAEDLPRTRRFGTPWIQMMKPSLFAPDAITEINFLPGRHSAEPQGQVFVPPHDELVLLHYKYLGFQRALARHRALARKLGPTDHANGWGHKYSWSRRAVARRLGCRRSRGRRLGEGDGRPSLALPDHTMVERVPSELQRDLRRRHRGARRGRWHNPWLDRRR